MLYVVRWDGRIITNYDLAVIYYYVHWLVSCTFLITVDNDMLLCLDTMISQSLLCHCTNQPAKIQ